MFKTVFKAAIVAAGVLVVTPGDGWAAVHSQVGASSARAGAASHVELAARIIRRGPIIVVRPYRVWTRRPYYGRVIAGVVLGTIVAAAVAGVVPPPPGPDVCWYWADRGRTRGYWDYC